MLLIVNKTLDCLFIISIISFSYFTCFSDTYTKSFLNSTRGYERKDLDASSLSFHYEHILDFYLVVLGLSGLTLRIVDRIWLFFCCKYSPYVQHQWLPSSITDWTDPHPQKSIFTIEQEIKQPISMFKLNYFMLIHLLWKPKTLLLLQVQHHLWSLHQDKELTKLKMYLVIWLWTLRDLLFINQSTWPTLPTNLPLMNLAP